jgi:hypothetical protein
VAEYIKRFRETRNRCYNLTVKERDMADLALVGLSYLCEKLEGQEFIDVNQVLQCGVAHENRARDSRSHNHLKEGARIRREVVSVW